MNTLKYVFATVAILVLLPFAAAHEANETHEEPETNASAAETPAANAPAAASTALKPQLPSPGITPDSPLFGLDRALEKLRLLLAFSEEGKAKAGLKNAAERVAEARAMVREKKIDAATKAREEHEAIISKVKQNVAALAAEGSIEEIKSQVEIEKKIEEQEEAVEEIEREVKLKIKGELTPEQQAAVDALITAFQNQNGRLKVEIQNKKNETKAKIRQKTGKPDRDVDREVEKIEDEKGVKKLKEEKASAQIADAEKALTEVEKELAGFGGDITAAAKLLEDAKDKLANAQFAFEAGKFGEAFGQARAAEVLIKNAERVIGKEEKKEEKAGGAEEAKEEAAKKEGKYSAGKTGAFGAKDNDDNNGAPDASDSDDSNDKEGVKSGEDKESKSESTSGASNGKSGSNSGADKESDED